MYGADGALFPPIDESGKVTPDSGSSRVDEHPNPFGDDPIAGAAVKYMAGKVDPFEPSAHEDDDAPIPAAIAEAETRPIAQPEPLPELAAVTEPKSTLAERIDATYATAADLESARDVPQVADRRAQLEAEPKPSKGARVVNLKASSNIKAASLDGAALSVSFNNGATATYGNVTDKLVDEWEAAKSAGSWFHNNIRMKSKDHPILKSTPIRQ